VLLDITVSPELFWKYYETILGIF